MDFFQVQKTLGATQAQMYDSHEKSRLAENIVDLVSRIKRINSFDSSIWNLSNVSRYDLERKNLDELKRLHSDLENRLLELNNQSQKPNRNREELEASMWTGQKPKNMSNYEFDRLQRRDDR